MVIFLERLPVKSRILHSVGYDEIQKILEIQFQTGMVYRYAGVPPKVFADLMRSEEIYKYFSAKVRPRFSAKQVSG